MSLLQPVNPLLLLILYRQYPILFWVPNTITSL